MKDRKYLLPPVTSGWQFAFYVVLLIVGALFSIFMIGAVIQYPLLFGLLFLAAWAFALFKAPL